MSKFLETIFEIVTIIAGLLFTITVSFLYPNILYKLGLSNKNRRSKDFQIPRKKPKVLWIIFCVSALIIITTPLFVKKVDSNEKNPNENNQFKEMYEQLDLARYSNWFEYPTYHSIKVSPGIQIIQGIPFQIPGPNEGIIQTQNIVLKNQPTHVEIEVNTTNIKEIYILLNGSYVYKNFLKSEVGIIKLWFEDGIELEIPIIAGTCLREGWFFQRDVDYPTIDSIDGDENCKNIFGENQTRDNIPAMAIIDMMIIKIPEQYLSYKLQSIILDDVSVQLVGSKNPSINIIAVTLEKRIYP